MKEKEVLLLLTDHWADWEASYAIARINSVPEYTVKTIAMNKASKISIGGLRTEIDYTVGDYQNFDNLAMVILTGSFSWQDDRYDEIADFVKETNENKIPIAAICGATIFLAKHGFLNDIKHTGDDPKFFQEQLENEANYTGHSHFEFAQVIHDQGFITANETAALAFSCEIFRTLKIDSDDDIKTWYQLFKQGMVDFE